MSSRITKPQPRRTALAVALAVGLGFTGAAMGQATTGAIFGSAPAGESVTVTSASGASRTVTVSADGSYTASNLPVGVYTVTLNSDGKTAATRGNVYIDAGGGTEVDFGTNASATELGAIQVTANALPAIDVTSTNTSMTVSAAQLEKLPLGHTAEDIALLAPGVVAASGYFNQSVTFAGAGATENAYYVNGFNTTALYNYTGSAYQLPYGAIAQQQTIVGGYGAKYGRADGGVINQIGKRGTNEWHFGALLTWSPRSLMSDPENYYYPNVELDPGETYSTPDRAGDLRRYRAVNKQWTTSKAVYAGGPLIKDRLFMYVAVQRDNRSARSNASKGTAQDTYFKDHSTRWYGKLDWNINDSNILEYTKLKSEERNSYGDIYRFDNVAKVDQEFLGNLAYDVYTNDTDIFHYTSYLSDAATLSILYGKTKVTNPIIVPNAVETPYISGADSQNPALNGGTPNFGAQPVNRTSSPLSAQGSKGLRVDFEYRLDDHTLQVGIDNLDYTATNQGRSTSGPGYQWTYETADPDKPLSTVLNVGAPGEGYIVRRGVFDTITSMSASQRAWYVQDNWQVTDKLLLQLGLRNDDFKNMNAQGDAFVVQKDQWEPRLGFSWDVAGDSSFKIYGTAGRYYLAIPQATGERAASGSVNTQEYFTYTGITSDGIPTGLSPVLGLDGSRPGPVSANNEFGQPPDPQTVTVTNLKPQYQDEYILGFDKAWGPDWVYGVKATYRTLGTAIDDECDPYTVRDKMTELGYDISKYQWGAPFCRLFNPNQTADIKVLGVGDVDPVIVPVTQDDFGNPDLQRDYYALEFHLEHPFDGTWMGRVSYTFARSWGNTEGQVRSEFGQTDVSVTEDWDYWQLMDHARGYLSNHRRHQIKAIGVWQVTPEWMLSGNLVLQSGGRDTCLGYFGPDKTDPGGGYGPNYHWCRGVPVAPGEDTLPWTKQLDLGVAYRPAFADHKLAFKLNIFNVTDSQEMVQDQVLRMSGPGVVSTYYHGALFSQPARSMRLSVSYDY